MLIVPSAGVAIDKIVLLDRGAKPPDLHQHLHRHLHITAEQAQEAARELTALRDAEQYSQQNQYQAESILEARVVISVLKQQQRLSQLRDAA
jgi:hypothetical protein